MPSPRSDLLRFIEAARQQGASDEFLSQLLRSYGWPQREIERAFFELYERLTEQPIPAPSGGAGESARDAFVYLLAFSTLGIWIQALGQLGFIYVNQFIPDPVSPSYGDPAFDVAFSLARLIVAYPVYLLLMRQLIKELRLYREKHYSGVRKWLTYLTLLIAALIGVGTLITFLTSFLRGELTLRFLLKVAIVLILDGGVLAYYGAWLRRRPVQRHPA